jgi:hypothetical protein
MTYTKQRRKKIYLKAACMVARNEERYGCDALREVSDLSNEYAVRSAFAEFFLFEPKVYEDRFPSYFGDQRGGWWKRNNKESRILALLLCAEMCNE